MEYRHIANALTLYATLNDHQASMWKLFKRENPIVFKSVTIDEYCPTITYDFKIKNLRDTHVVDILAISFHGTYREGAAGSPDAGLMKGIIKTGVSVFDPFALLIDLSDLEYNWGDNLDLSFEEAAPTKTVVLVGEKCRRAMSTLSFGIDTEKDIVDNEFFFDVYDRALEKLINKQQPQ
ncbi:hypothetical protein [Foetidibacter luteolus]|uniref:hypothetical protein n=1 Tax=Foetidibacter luteolus TaxID=2608880 RepID=UPI00129B4C16|nr:hypothetical protein [Foetidibacter luteolus]